MAFLKRFSNSLWDYVSPRKTTNTNALPTPKTEPTFKKPALPARRASMHDIAKQTRSMSPGERVGNWRIRSPSSQASSSVISRKRKRLFTPSSTSAGRKGKMPKIDLEGMEDDFDGDTLMEDEYDDGESLRPRSQPRFRSSSPALGDEDDEDAMSVNKTVVASEGEYVPIKRVVDLPAEHHLRHISADELRAKGFDDDYITLIQKIGMRGYEPLLPAYLKFEYSFLPDGLFEQGDEAFVASVRAEHFKAGKALERLLELGGRVRDRIYMQGHISPEEQVKAQLSAYQTWAFDDAEIDRHSAIPILAMEFQPADTPPNIMKANAARKCKRLANRYREALRVQRSVEISPGSRSSNSTVLSYPLPTFYTIIASHAIIAIMSYRPDAENPGVEPMAYFDLKDKDYDVWNSLALAIIICHVRNVQMRIADETGIGLRQRGYSDEEMEEFDPDE